MSVQKFACALFAIVFFMSCSDEPSGVSVLDETKAQLTEAELKVLLRMRDPNNRVSIDEAMKEANWAIDVLNGEGSLKSGSNRKISSISTLVSDKAKPVALKSSDVDDIEIPDTLAYILNFNDSLGFAIISADTRIDDPILAFTESGSLIDSTDNPGIAIFLEHLEDYMINSIVEAERQYDSLIAGILEKLDIEIETGTKGTEGDKAAAKAAAKATTKEEAIKQIVDSILPMVPVEWRQGAPFNDNLDKRGCKDKDGNIKNNGKVLAGCVAVATAHIMSRWKYPSSINGYSFDWAMLNEKKKADDFKKDSSETIQVANLMQQIGKAVNMDYGCDGSGANTGSAINLLRNLGFSIGGLVSYDPSNAIVSMKKREPLIVRGCSKEIKYEVFVLPIISFFTFYDGCHTWVIDGYIKRRVTVGSVNLDFDYVHNNWGWNGKDNGYYSSGVFNSNIDPMYNSNVTTKSSESLEESGQDYNYQYVIQMASYIRR